MDRPANRPAPGSAPTPRLAATALARPIVRTAGRRPTSGSVRDATAPCPTPPSRSAPGHIAIFGPQSVGKTTYVTVLLHELDHRVGPERGFVLDPLTDEIRDRYEREYHETTYGGSRFGIGEELSGESFRHSHSATPSLETNRGVLQPLVYRLTRRAGRRSARRSSALLSFFDTAGEDWEMNIDLLRSEARYLAEARGLLFLIDPLRIRAVAHDPRHASRPRKSAGSRPPTT